MGRVIRGAQKKHHFWPLGGHRWVVGGKIISLSSIYQYLSYVLLVFVTNLQVEKEMPMRNSGAKTYEGVPFLLRGKP